MARSLVLQLFVAVVCCAGADLSDVLSELTAELQPLTSHHVTLAGVEASFQQRPTRKSSAHNNLAIMLHGCTHRARDWFELPADRVVVRHLLYDRAFSVLALSPLETCWSVAADLDRAEAAVRAFRREEPDVPTGRLVLVGASSGGVFAPHLAQRLGGALGQIIIVSPGAHVPEQPQRSAFVLMRRDVSWATRASVERVLDSVPNHRYRVWVCDPLPLSSHTLADSIDGFPTDASKLFAKTARDLGFVERKSRLLKSDPRSSGLLESVIARVRSVESGDAWAVLGAHRREISQVLNTLFAEHEMTSQHFIEALTWILRAA